MLHVGSCWTSEAVRVVRGSHQETVHFTIAEPGGIQTNFATSSMANLTPHPAYAAPDTPSRLMSAAIAHPDFQKGWTDPANMAQAIVEVVSRRKPIPIRFPLGAASFATLRDEVDKMAKEFDEIKSISVGVDTTAQAAAQVAGVKQMAT